MLLVVLVVAHLYTHNMVVSFLHWQLYQMWKERMPSLVIPFLLDTQAASVVIFCPFNMQGMERGGVG